MTIVAEKNYSFVTWNTEQIGKTITETKKDGREWQTLKFARSPIMSTYVMAFVVANYDCEEKTTQSNLGDKKDIVLRVCGRPSLINNGYATYALDTGENILKYFETYFNQPYPLSKCDHVGISDFEAGAMENWGLIIYREEYLLFNPENDPTKSKGQVNLVVSHELAHMWFGNLVTMEWWNDIWLNEGFATYVQSLGTEDSTEYVNDPFLMNEWRVTSMSQDSYLSSRPASVVVTDPGNVHHLFDAIAYNKGASLLRQMNMVMDHTEGDNEKDTDFQDGVKAYLDENKYSNADQSQLYGTLDKFFTSKSDPKVTVEQIMKTWTLQMNFPVVTVEEYDNGNLILSQRRFLIADEGQSEGSQTSPYAYQWYVPIKYKTHKDNDAEPKISSLKWIRPNGHLVTPIATDESIFVNWDGNGFYVTSYSLDLWNKLITDRSTLKLSSREMQVLLYDTYLLVNAGYYPLSRQLQLLEIFAANEDYSVLREAFRQIGMISSLIKMEEGLLRTWKGKWEDVSATQYNNAKALKNDVESVTKVDYVKQLRKSLTMDLCLTYNNNTDDTVACVSAAKKIWVERETTKILPDDKAAVYSYAARASSGDWDALWKMYVNPLSTAAEKKLLATALAQTEDEAIVKKYIGYCMDDTKVRKSNGLYIMGRSIATANSVSAKVSLDYMLENWPAVYENFQTLGLECPRYIKTVISQITSEDDLTKVKVKFEDSKTGYMNDVIKADYESAMDTARNNIQWLAKNKDSLN